MKKQFIKLTAALVLLSTLILGACNNPVSPALRADMPAGKGVVRVETGAAAARTAVPTVSFAKYEYWFAKGSDAAALETPVAGVFELDAGSYTVTVMAFVSAGDTTPATQGTSGAFTIAAGADAGSIRVILEPVIGVGQGTLSFALAFPDTAVVTAFTLTRVGGADTFDLKAAGTAGTGSFAGTQAAIGAGYWLARASLSNGDVYVGKSEVAHIYDNMTTELAWTFAEENFAAIPVVSAADSGPGTLREALTRANAGLGGKVFIDLPEGGNVITLATPLPPVAASLVLEGNSATLTQNGTMSGNGANLLRISDPAALVTIRRLRFTGGMGNRGGAIHNSGSLALESCIFSGNRATTSAGLRSFGGALWSDGLLTVRGCTFYDNHGSAGGAIYTDTPAFLAGNLFFENTGFGLGGIENCVTFTNIPETIQSEGFNISDWAEGYTHVDISGNYNSGYLNGGGDQFNVKTVSLSLVSLKPVQGGAAAGALTALPAGYPVTDFYGAAITLPGAIGAIQAQTQAGYFLRYGENNSSYGAAAVVPAPDADGIYASGASITFTATPAAIAGVLFSHWTIDGAVDPANPLVLSMDTHKTIQAVFVRQYTVTDTGDTAGSASAVTFRYAVANATDGDTISLPEGGTIALTGPLPEITTGIVIEGNGATLTRDPSYTAVSDTSQLLSFIFYEKTASVKISRLRFTGGRATNYGGAIHNQMYLTLESCVFDDNQPSGVYNNRRGLIVRGCTFYNNAAAICYLEGTVALTGNAFFGNSMAVYRDEVGHGSSTSGGYNVSDRVVGEADSNYTPALSDMLNAVLPISPVSLKPVQGGAAVGALAELPLNYPAVDFYGAAIPVGGAAGAIQAQTAQAGYYLDYGVNIPAYGTVSASLLPDTDGLYAPGEGVTLTAVTGTGVALSHWTINGADSGDSNPLYITMDDHKTVRAIMGRNFMVTDTGDTAGSESAITLRYALNNAFDDDTITLPAGQTITLTSPLPQIAKNIVILGKGATLTQSGFVESNTSQLLYISGGTVTISRLHFKGGRATTFGAAIQNRGKLTLESCIFSDNQTSSGLAQGGAVYTNGSLLTVRGCTFYNNRSGYVGGAICALQYVTLTGNLFYGNFALSSGNVGYNPPAVIGPPQVRITSSGYNVSDKTAGTTNDAVTSGYAANANGSDVFSVAALPLSQINLKPIAGGAAAGRLPSPLPTDYPDEDFDGVAIAEGGAAGALQTLIAGTGYSLDYGVNSAAYGTANPNSSPDADGFYTSGTNVTLTAQPASLSGLAFSHWTINGAESGNSNPLSITMDAHKTVRAVFLRNYVISAADTQGTAEAPTLRYALSNAADGDTITFPAGQTITLTNPLPQVLRSIVIEGNGATLTQSGFTESADSQLLYISVGGTVTISRLHFKGGRATNNGAAILTTASLSLESCVFSDNQTSYNVSASLGSFGGAVYANGASLTVRGCTFYNNHAVYRGGAIYCNAGTVALTGNLFFENTAAQSGNVYGTGVTSGGYNVSDKAAGTVAATGSGYSSATGDLFGVTDIVFATGGDPTTKPSSSALGAGGLKTLTTLPADFPATYFDGTPRSTIPATAGAVSAD